jgi:hypothetical protein
MTDAHTQPAHGQRKVVTDLADQRGISGVAR